MGVVVMLTLALKRWLRQPRRLVPKPPSQPNQYAGVNATTHSAARGRSSSP